MTKNEKIPGGTAHEMPADLKKSLTSSPKSLAKWQNISPIARNEWICWIENAKLIETRKRRIERTRDELAEGKGRPCCWMGCIHRTDKPMSASQKAVTSKAKK